MAKMSRMERTSYRALRASLIHRGYTLRSFALANGYSVPTVYMAARGLRSGIIASRIRRHLEELIND